MRLLLDSNIVVPFSRQELRDLSAKINLLLQSPNNDIFVSAASLWEIAIKTRLGKLDPLVPLHDLPGYFAAFGFGILPIDAHHVLADLDDVPETRDPFDRLLLAQCQLEDMRLVTTDRKLMAHPLAWHEGRSVR